MASRCALDARDQDAGSNRTVVEARVQSVAILIASPFTMRASSISACTVVAARRRTSPSLTSEQLIEAAHVGDEGVDQIPKAARSGRTAIEAR